MTDAKVLVVEDDGIIGRHIQKSLERLGYECVGVFLSGEEAVKKVGLLNPDLVLMDISLAGEMDGVQAAELIHRQMNLPVVFLTAYADPQTLQRAKITDPFGYLLKPFDEKKLQITIEIAIYKFQMERRLVESEEMLRTLVDNQAEGVSLIDPNGKLMFCNPAMDSILGLKAGESLGKNILDFTNEANSAQLLTESDKRRTGVRSVYELEITRPSGEQRIMAVNASPWIDKNGNFTGSFVIANDITEQKQIAANEKRARALAEALRDTGAALNSTLDMDEVLGLVLRNVGRVIPNENASIMMLEGDKGRIFSRLTHTLSGDETSLTDEEVHWKDYSVFCRLIDTGQPVVFSIIDSTDAIGPVECVGWMRSYIGAPLGVKDRVFGCINLGSSIPGFFSQQHVGQLEAFAFQAALALDNARLFMETRRRAHFLTMLNEITHLAINVVDENQTIGLVIEKMNQLFTSDGTFITTWDPELQQTIPAAGYGVSSEIYTSLTSKPGELTLTASVLRAGHPLAVEDVRDTTYIDSELSKTFPMHSLLGLPLIADGIPLGAIIIGFKDRHQFTQEEIDNGTQVSRQVALAVSKARLYSQVQRMSITDELTGFLNRRGIFELGRAMFKEARRTQQNLALIWMDIDHFKSVNDSYGHHIGDQVVAGVAEVCRGSVRDNDIVGRYGGEGGDELIVMLPQTELDAAQFVAERLRQRISSEPIHTEKGPVAVTVSMGISILSNQITDLTGLLIRADQAMYVAKSSGRNCVVVAAEV